MTSDPTVLVVDDEVQMRRLLRMTLEANGYRVVLAETGKEGLTRAGTDRPELVVLDLGLPDMDGLELLRRLKQTIDLPVIFLTSKDEEIDELMGLNAGADDYIRKPFSQRLLLERVKAVLRRARDDNWEKGVPYSFHVLGANSSSSFGSRDRICA